MKKYILTLAIIIFCFIPSLTYAIHVDYHLGADDHARLYIDNSLIAHLNSAGGTYASVDLDEGWYDFGLIYWNAGGSNGLGLLQDYDSTGVYQTIPLEYYCSLDQDDEYINGLRADYYTFDGSSITTIYGEGPIHHGHSVTAPGVVYEGEHVLWAGIFGGWSCFEERLSGQIYVGSSPPNPIPEPATMLLFSTGLAGLAVLRRKRKGSRV